MWISTDTWGKGAKFRHCFEFCPRGAAFINVIINHADKGCTDFHFMFCQHCQSPWTTFSVCLLQEFACLIYVCLTYAQSWPKLVRTQTKPNQTERYERAIFKLFMRSAHLIAISAQSRKMLQNLLRRLTRASFFFPIRNSIKFSSLQCTQIHTHPRTNTHSQVLTNFGRKQRLKWIFHVVFSTRWKV